MKRIINAIKAPKAIGPYSQAVEINGLLYISGQIAIDPESGAIIKGGIKEQTERVIKNIEAILKAAGYDLKDVVKTTCMLSDIQNFKEMNEVYGKHFSNNPPARAAFETSGLPFDALIEIDTIAVKNS